MRSFPSLRQAEHAPCCAWAVVKHEALLVCDYNVVGSDVRSNSLSVMLHATPPQPRQPTPRRACQAIEGTFPKCSQNPRQGTGWRLSPLARELLVSTAALQLGVDAVLRKRTLGNWQLHLGHGEP
jgi:hypothetical protein